MKKNNTGAHDSRQLAQFKRLLKESVGNQAPLDEEIVRTISAMQGSPDDSVDQALRIIEGLEKDRDETKEWELISKLQEERAVRASA